MNEKDKIKRRKELKTWSNEALVKELLEKKSLYTKEGLVLIKEEVSDRGVSPSMAIPKEEPKKGKKRIVKADKIFSESALIAYIIGATNVVYGALANTFSVFAIGAAICLIGYFISKKKVVALELFVALMIIEAGYRIIFYFYNLDTLNKSPNWTIIGGAIFIHGAIAYYIIKAIYNNAKLRQRSRYLHKKIWEKIDDFIGR